MITAFPKIFAIGKDYIRDIFSDGPVEITEKIDGSQFAFGLINGELVMRSKGKVLINNAPEKMFREACSYIESISFKLPENVVFYCEYLQRTRHNTLAYTRIPKNHLMLFGVKSFPGETFLSDDVQIAHWADELGIESIPFIGSRTVKSPGEFSKIIDAESALGGAKMEGVVVKNYNRPFLLGGQPIPLMAGKFVSESFKEVHKSRWGKEETGKGRFDVFLDSFRTEARWQKAVQHLAEKGELLNEPRDIGNLIKELQSDIATEEKDAIKNWLWHEFSGQIFRVASKGFPEWYKSKLVERSFEVTP